MKEIIKNKLKSLDPISLEIIDESYLHKGHAGYKEGGETHFKIEIISNVFQNMKLIDRHRLVKKLLDEELKTKIHALSLRTKTEEE
jgi:BolA protein